MASTKQSKLSNDKKRQLRTIGHGLKPVVMVGSKGLSENVLEEVQRALNDHELIKVKFAVGNRDVKMVFINQLCEVTGAELIQTIGNIALILRRANKPKANLSNLTKFKQ